jgi:hypothetical protein
VVIETTAVGNRRFKSQTRSPQPLPCVPTFETSRLLVPTPLRRILPDLHRPWIGSVPKLPRGRRRRRRGRQPQLAVPIVYAAAPVELKEEALRRLPSPSECEPICLV